MSISWRRLAAAALATGLVTTVAVTGSASGSPSEEPRALVPAEVSDPIPGEVPGDRNADDVADTHPFFSTPDNLKAKGYVEEEFYLSGTADAYEADGTLVAEDVPYRTRMIVRRPLSNWKFNGSVLVEWQNVSAGYDLDALWNYDTVTRDGYAWVGVSAQRVGVDMLKDWSPARYGDLDVTGGGEYTSDQLSYDIYAQAAAALEDGAGMGRLRVDSTLAIGASQSAGRMTVYYDNVLPQVEPVFDGYDFVVGSAPSRVGDEPVFQVMSETDVRSDQRPEDTDRFRRWEVAGGAHSGYQGQQYRAPISERDLPGGAPEYDCANPPFSRMPMHHVTASSYHHLKRWVERGTPPPTADPLEFEADGVTKVRDELGLAQGGIRLSQIEAPRALNNGDNSGQTFCFLFGTHVPFDEQTLDTLYPSRGKYLRQVRAADRDNVRAGYLMRADAVDNWHEALEVSR